MGPPWIATGVSYPSFPGASPPAASAITQQALELAADDAVALTRGTLETLPVQDGEPASPEANEARSLERAGGNRHRRPPHAEHLGEKLLGEGKLVGAHPIVRQQQPAAAALLHRVQAVTGDLLRDLTEQRLGVALQHAAKRSVRRHRSA